MMNSSRSYIVSSTANILEDSYQYYAEEYEEIDECCIF